MKSQDFRKIQRQVDLIQGLECWNVGAGGCVGSSFSLALGKKVRRSRPLKNPTVSDEFREYEGEACLLVWCTWRLGTGEAPIASSDEESDRIAKSLQALVGQKVVRGEVSQPACDMTLTFTNGLRLNVFCDHIPGHPSYSGNWQLHVGGSILLVGPGYDWEME